MGNNYASGAGIILVLSSTFGNALNPIALISSISCLSLSVRIHWQM